MNTYAQPTPMPIAPPTGGHRRRVLASSTSPPPPVALHGLDAARKQIEHMTGSADTECGFRTINSQLPAGDPNKSIEKWGTLGALHPWLLERCQAGCNAYIVPQDMPRPAAGQARNSGITAVRSIFADYDGTSYPKEHHVNPTFRLDHGEAGRYWDFWAVSGVDLTQREDLLRRSAMHYGSDPKVATVMVVRLAGFDRWKDGKNYGPYTLTVLSGQRTEAWQHEALPKLPPREKHTGKLDAPDVISEKRLRDVLAFIDPVDRDDWRNVIFAVRDAKVLDGNLGVLDEGAVFQISDEWASGELHAKHTGPKLPRLYVGTYVGPEDTEALFFGKRGTRAAVTLGSAVHMAKEHAQKQGVQVPPETCRPGATEFGMRATIASDAAQPNDDDAPASSWAVRLRDVKAAPTTWIIDKLLGEKNLGLISGGQGSLKTQDLIMMEVCCITGRPYYGHPVVKTGPILHCALEDEDATKARLAAVCEDMDLSEEELAKVDDWFFVKSFDVGMKLPQDLALVQQAISGIEAEIGRPLTMVGIDTLREVLVGSVSDEKDVSPLLDALKTLARPGRAVVAVGHISADSAGKNLEERKPKGLSDFTDRADVVVLKEADVNAGTAAFFTLKVKNAPARQRFNLTVRPGLGGIPVQSLAGVGALMRGGATWPEPAPRTRHDPRPDPAFDAELDDAIVKFLGGNFGGQFSAANLAEALVSAGINRSVSSLPRILKDFWNSPSRRCHKLFVPGKGKQPGHWRGRSPRDPDSMWQPRPQPSPPAFEGRSDRVARSEVPLIDLATATMGGQA